MEVLNQMHEARAGFVALFKNGMPALGIVLALMLSAEIWFTADLPMFSFGCLVGCVYASANLAALFWLMAPFFFFREKALYLIGGVVLSLGMGAILMFVATFMGNSWAIGLAMGVASPALIGTLYSLQSLATTSKS